MALVVGKPRSFYKKFKFVVEIGGIKYAGFQDCSELSSDTAKVEQWEGGSLIADKSPGRVTFPDITLARGATDDEDLFNWYRDVSNIASNSGLVDPAYKRNADIVQQDRSGATIMRWRVFRGWPVKFVAGAWDNKSDENVIESVTLTYDFFDRVTRAA